jgi:peptidoglycan/LPS O-acetylase OafA/YrhL
MVVLITSRAWGQGISFGWTTALATVGAARWGAPSRSRRRAQRFLTRPAVRWLGTRSFALYLIHEPVVTSLGYLTGRTPPLALFLLLAVPTSLLAAELFFRGIERPAHRLARRTGRAVAARRAGAGAPLVTPAETAHPAA